MTNPFDEYKNALQAHNEYITELKREVAEIIAARQLTPSLNDTKWLELQNAIRDLPFPPPYIVKCVTDTEESSTGRLDDPPDYLGDWSSYYEEGLPPFFNIEWIKVCPRYGKNRGRLVEKEIIDETTEFVAILKQYFIPFEVHEHMFTIYGYK